MRKSYTLATVIYALATMAAQAASHVASTEQVVMNHLKAFGALDVDAIVADYSPDASLITPDRVYRGTEDLRAFFEDLVEEFSQPGITMETQSLVFEGNTGLLVWTGESPQNVYRYATDTYVVEDGMIVSHTFSGLITPK